MNVETTLAFVALRDRQRLERLEAERDQPPIEPFDWHAHRRKVRRTIVKLSPWRP